MPREIEIKRIPAAPKAPQIVRVAATSGIRSGEAVAGAVSGMTFGTAITATMAKISVEPQNTESRREAVFFLDKLPEKPNDCIRYRFP